MNSGRTVATGFLCSLLLMTLLAPHAFAGETKAKKKPAGKLERLKASPVFLKVPEGVEGKFVVAKTVPKIDFGIFPGQWEGAHLWSNWGDSLFGVDGKFYASLGDHDGPVGTAYVYKIDADTGAIEQVVDYNEHISVPKGMYTPGKIHGALVQPVDGDIYFFGYRGSVRKTGPETQYKGDWLLKYSPKTGETKNLGIAVPYCSTPVLSYSPANNGLYGLSVFGKTMPEPQHNQFIHYDIDSGKLAFSHALTVKAGPRAMIVSDDGPAFFGEKDDAGNGYLMKYDPKTKKVTKSATVPGNGVLRAASKPNPEGIAYCLSHDGFAFAFNTKTEKVRNIGEGWVAQPMYTASCRLDPTNTYLYYLPGAHGRSSRSGSPVIQLNVKTGVKKVIAFLHEGVKQQKKYNLGGTFGIALSDDGSKLFVNFNGSEYPLKKSPDFGLCAAMIIHIPESER